LGVNREPLYQTRTKKGNWSCY